MALTKEIGHDERVKMVALREAGWTTTRIAARFGRTAGAVWKVCKKYLQTDSVDNRGGRGRKRATTKREDRLVTRLVTRGEAQTAVECSRIVQNVHGVDVSGSTVRRRLKEAGLVARVKRAAPSLLPRHAKARLAWAKAHQNWTKEQWESVVWSDESKFMLFRSDGREWCWVRKGTRPCLRPTKPTVKFGGGHVMVWGCFSAKGVGNLTMVSGVMDAEYYKDILEDNLLESIDELHGENPCVFQQDNDRKHTSRTVQAWLEENNIPTMTWPSQSPDRNPIEHLWDELERRIHKRTPPNTKEELWEIIQQEWLQIPSSVTQNLVNSMPKRVREVLEAGGWNTTY